MGWIRQAETGLTARDRETARASLDEAIRIADLLGAGTAPGPGRGPGPTVTRRGSSDPPRLPRPSELTSREREVLGLLAEGRTNRQIAEALFLSAKTVEIHVSRILDKLGRLDPRRSRSIARRSGQLGAAE